MNLSGLRRSWQIGLIHQPVWVLAGAGIVKIKSSRFELRLEIQEIHWNNLILLSCGNTFFSFWNVSLEKMRAILVIEHIIQTKGYLVVSKQSRNKK